MLDEKPLNQISVKELVERCEINRNTFYYHFQDMPELIEDIVKDLADECIRQYPQIQSIEEICEVALSFAFENKKIVLHVYNSVSRDIFERYLMELCDYAVTEYVNTVISDRTMPPEQKNLVIRLLKCTCFGVVIDWLSNGMKEDLRVPFKQLCDMNKMYIENVVVDSSYRLALPE